MSVTSVSLLKLCVFSQYESFLQSSFDLIYAKKNLSSSPCSTPLSCAAQIGMTVLMHAVAHVAEDKLTENKMMVELLIANGADAAAEDQVLCHIRRISLLRHPLPLQQLSC